MVKRISVNEYQHLDKRKRHVWPFFVGLAMGMAMGTTGIHCFSNIESAVEATSRKTYEPWGEITLTNEQATNPGAVLGTCAACLREQGAPADKMDLTYNIGKRFEEKYGKKLVWGALHEGDTLPLPEACAKRYSK
jgi:hypothetical protein